MHDFHLRMQSLVTRRESSMAVISFFLCRDETGHGCVHRGSTNQPPGSQHHSPTAALVPTLWAGSHLLHRGSSPAVPVSTAMLIFMSTKWRYLCAVHLLPQGTYCEYHGLDGSGAWVVLSLLYCFDYMTFCNLIFLAGSHCVKWDCFRVCNNVFDKCSILHASIHDLQFLSVIREVAFPFLACLEAEVLELQNIWLSF